MLTQITIRNFKTLESAEIPLGQNVVLIGPNNSGKTSALQALALWNSGLREWHIRRSDGSKAKKRTGVTVNRKSLTHTPVPQTKMLWHGLKVTSATRLAGKLDATKNIHIEINVEGNSNGNSWSCGFEFQHANSESIYCRPLKVEDDDSPFVIPQEAIELSIALLPPMSGLAAEEPEIRPGRISVLVGEGQTAQVLRNLCYQVAQRSADDWSSVVAELKRTFGIELSTPIQDPARGTIRLDYEQNGIKFDLSSAGRGQQQTLLLLAHMYANPRSILLLDEPDAHLEILRQRQLYQLITETASRLGSQVIAASHSEILLNEAADRDVVVAFVGRPHRIDDRGSQVLKSLKEIGFDQYFLAEQTGFVLYLEGSTDLYILRKFAQKLAHASFALLDKPFVHYVANQPSKAAGHFHGLREAKQDLRAFALFDNLGASPALQGFPIVQWRKKEIENYFTTETVLLRYAEGLEPDDLVGMAIKAQRKEAMQKAIAEVVSALATLGKDAWSSEVKASEEVLPNVLRRFYEYASIKDRIGKTDYHQLADFLLPEEFDPEIRQVLDQLHTEALLSVPEV
jgi:ABC-type branched-subunit amino acid transport system ATPase component